MPSKHIGFMHKSHAFESFPHQAVIPLVSEEAIHQCYDHALKLIFALQKTLNIHEVIETFFQLAKKAVPFEYLRFKNIEQDIDVPIGRKSPHQADYHLSLEDNPLGSITFSRQQPFKEEELSTLEFLLSSLIHPLRNATQYCEALKNSLKDVLTNVGNRRAMLLELHRDVELNQRHQTPFCLMILDIDNFKSINDALGHRAGDLLIQKTVKSLCDCIRGSDVIFRYGGDEFVVLLRKTDNEGAKQLAERVKRYIQSTVSIENQTQHNGPISISIGLATLEVTDDADSLFDKADNALLQAKKNGRNRIYIAGISNMSN